MSLTPRISVLFAAVGSAIATAVTMIHYARAAQSSAPGDYWSWVVGAVTIGILCSAASVYAQPPADRTWLGGVAVAAIGAALGAIVLLAAIVLAFGS